MKCKTQLQVCQQLVRVATLITGTEVAIWNMYRYKGCNVPSKWNPVRCDNYEELTFAISIVEGKPVFVGDTLFHTASNGTVTPFIVGEYWQLVDVVGAVSWTAPKKTTFVINGKELPLPEYTEKHTYGYYLRMDFLSNFRWKTENDMLVVENTLLQVLKGYDLPKR